MYRTAYQYAGAYHGKWRSLMDFGERWYDARRELFLDGGIPPAAIRSASSRLLSCRRPTPTQAPTPSGTPTRAASPFTIAKANDVVSAAWDKSDEPKLSGFGVLGPVGSWIDAGTANHLPTSFATLGAGMDRAAAKKWQDTAEMFDPNPLIDIDPAEGTVKLGAPYGKRAKFGRHRRGDPCQTRRHRHRRRDNGRDAGGEQQPELERIGNRERRRRNREGVRHIEAVAGDADEGEEERPGQEAARPAGEERHAAVGPEIDRQLKPPARPPERPPAIHLSRPTGLLR